MAIIHAPFTDEQVTALNNYQRSDRHHPFTCGNDRSDDAHIQSARALKQHERGVLVATNAGWICPACDYKQYSAYEHMTHPIEPSSLDLFMDRLRKPIQDNASK